MSRAVVQHSTLALALVVAHACSKGKSAGSDAPTGETTEAGKIAIEQAPSPATPVPPPQPPSGPLVGSGAPPVVVSGTLGLEVGLVDAGPGFDKVIAFPIDDGKPSERPDQWKVATVDANGAFELALDRGDVKTQIALIDKILVNGELDVAAFLASELLNLFPITPADKDKLKAAGTLPDAEKADVIAKLNEYKAKLKDSGGRSYVLVGLEDKGGDRVAEGRSFAYIGLGTAAGNLMNLPLKDAAKDALPLGMIKAKPADGSGVRTNNDARSETNATPDTFALAAETIDQLAATSSILKGIKNVYMNAAESGLSWSTSPYFIWQGSDAAVPRNGELSLATMPAYRGYGLYFDSQAVTDLDVLCDDRQPKFKHMKLLPPPGKKLKPYQKEDSCVGGQGVTEVDFLDNKPVPMVRANTNDPGRIECTVESTMNSSSSNAPSFYAHGQPAGAEYPHVGFNWGGGDGFTGPVAEGLWTLQLDGEAVAHFEFADGYPMKDVAGTPKPKVYIPRLGITRDATTKRITGVKVRLALYDFKSGEFRDVTDLRAFNRVASELSFGMDDYNGTTRSSLYERLVQPEPGSHEFTLTIPEVYTDRGGAKYSWYDTDKERPANPPSSPIFAINSALSVSYMMYGNNYRFEFRPSHAGGCNGGGGGSGGGSGSSSGGGGGTNSLQVKLKRKAPAVDGRIYVGARPNMTTWSHDTREVALGTIGSISHAGVQSLCNEAAPLNLDVKLEHDRTAVGGNHAHVMMSDPCVVGRRVGPETVLVGYKRACAMGEAATALNDLVVELSCTNGKNIEIPGLTIDNGLDINTWGN